MDPQQELFSEIVVRLRTKGYDVYDGALPPEGTKYPFIYIADSQQNDRTTKNAVIGTVNQRIHAWHNDPCKRGVLSGILFEVKGVCRKIEHTSNYGWMLSNVEQRILDDDTTDQPLLHGVIDFEYQFS